MEPVTMAIAVGLGAQAVSGIMQYYQAEKARKATNTRLKQIEAMFNAIVPPDLELNVWDDPKLAQSVPEPMFNFEAVTPELYKSVGQFVPEIADYVAEKNPELVRATANAKEGRQAQLDALSRYKKIASGEFDPELAQMLSEASQRSNREAQSRSASILQDANRRGQIGSGLTLAAQLSSGEDAMQRQAIDSQRAAAEAYRNRLMALDKSADLGGNIRASEMNEEARNVGIINDFAERTNKNYQNWLNQKADQISQARLANLNRDQSIADNNVSLKNKTKVDNINRWNTLQGQQFDARRANRQDQVELKKDKDRARQQVYENLLAKARGSAGIAQTGIDYLRSDARDRSQAIRGVGDTISSGAMYYGTNAPRTSASPNDQGFTFDDYDEGTTKGNYRRADSDYWRTS